MTVVQFHDLALADRDREWDGRAANQRVRKWAGAEEGPNERYRRAFVWYVAEQAEKFKAYKFQIADIVDGDLKAIPRAIISAAGVMQGARGGTDLPKAEISRVKGHLARYYEKMGDTPPWD